MGCCLEGFLEGREFKRREKDILKHYLPQVEAASLFSIILAFLCQKAVRVWPKCTVHFILWSSFAMSLLAGILLVCFQKPTTDVCGLALIAFAIGNGLYSCWVTQRTKFCTKILMKSLEPVSKFLHVGGGVLVDVLVDFGCDWSYEFLFPPAHCNCTHFKLGLDY